MSYEVMDPQGYDKATRLGLIRQAIPENFEEVPLDLLANQTVALPDLIFYCYTEEHGVAQGTWEYVSYFMETQDPRYNASFQSGTIFAVPAGVTTAEPVKPSKAAPAPRDPLAGLTDEQKEAARKDFLNIITEWATAASALEKAKAKEDTLRAKLEKAWIFTGNKGEFADGWEVSRDYPETTEMDSAAWIAVKPKITEAGWNPEVLVRTKFALEKKKYNTLPAEVKKIVDTTITTKVGKVQIKVKEIKK